MSTLRCWLLGHKWGEEWFRDLDGVPFRFCARRGCYATTTRAVSERDRGTT